MNSRTACGWNPLSLRLCNDHVLGSFHPMYSPDFIFWVPFDLDIFTPEISNCPL